MRVLSLHNQIIAPLDLATAQWITGTVFSVVSIDKAIHQMLVAPVGDAQTGGLDNPRRLFSDVIDPQAFGIETFCIPFTDFQAQRLAQQGLPRAQFVLRAGVALGIGVVELHLREAVWARQLVLPGVGRLDQVRGIIPVRSDLTDGSTWHV